MCCNARLQQGGKVSIYGRKQKFSWQGQSEGQHKNKKQRWWVWKSKEAFFSFWCWFVVPPQNKPIQKTTQGISWSLLSYWTDGQKLWLLPREQRDTLRRALTVWCLSLCVSERGGGGGGGEICPFSIRLLFPSLVTAVAREILFCETPLNIYKCLCREQQEEIWHARIWHSVEGPRVKTAGKEV